MLFSALAVLCQAHSLSGSASEISLSKEASAETLVEDVVLILQSGTTAAEIEAQTGMRWLGRVGALPRTHRFRLPEPIESSQTTRLTTLSTTKLNGVEEVIPMVKRMRYSRSSALPTDPRFPGQWHIQNTGQERSPLAEDANILAAWKAGATGQGVTVGVVDTAIEYNHPDLRDNHATGLRYDYIRNTSDPSSQSADPDDHHGTPVTGIIAASRNNQGTVGVAYDAQFAAYRLIGEAIDAGQEAAALTANLDVVDIYNNSWGPGDQFGVIFAGPEGVVTSAIRTGVAEGRGGRGAVYVWAAGNGRESGDRADYDGYSSMAETIAVAAVGSDGVFADYSEPGACLLISAPSRGLGPGILTTDATGSLGYSFSDVTQSFGGTSAAAPLVSGVVALMLQANPNLGWRDVQHILLRTAQINHATDSDWTRNAAGFPVNHNYGFGRVDAGAAVALAGIWNNRPTATSTTNLSTPNLLLQESTRELTLSIAENLLIEHVDLTLSTSGVDFGNIRLVLTSPEGTESVLVRPHSNNGGQSLWTFLSTRHWGELSAGTWKLSVRSYRANNGRLNNWRINIRGTSQNRPAPIASESILSLNSTDFPLTLDPAASGLPAGLQLLSLDLPARGTLAEAGNGRFEYRMNRDFRGTDRLGFLYGDASGRIHRAQFSVHNPAPAAVDDSFVLTAGTEIELQPLGNDFDPDGDSLRIVAVDGAELKGQVELINASSLRYRPPATPPARGFERFSYTITDDRNGQGTGWITLLYAPSNERALHFDGIDDEVFIAANSAISPTNGFTLAAWIYLDGWGEHSTGFGRIFDKDKIVFFPNGHDHAYYEDESLVCFLDLADGSSAAINSPRASLQLGRWHHVAVTFIPTTFPRVRLFIDGVEQPQSFPIPDAGAPGSGARIASNSSNPIRFGESANGDRAFEGRIAEIYLSEAQTNPSSTAPATGLLAHWDFREGLGLSTSDTTNRYAGQLRGPQWTIRDLPWAPLNTYFPFLRDNRDGWWQDPILGWMRADDFPWIYLAGLGWSYLSGPGDTRYDFYPIEHAVGWLTGGPAIYPWFYSSEQDEWLYNFPGSPWFYSSLRQDWLLLPR